MVVVHFVAGPYTALVAEGVHSLVDVVNVRILHVPVHVDLVEYFGVGKGSNANDANLYQTPL